MKKVIIGLLGTLAVLGATNTAYAEDTRSGFQTRRGDLAVYVNILGHSRTAPVELKNFNVGVAGGGYDFQYKASAVMHTGDRDEARFSLNLPANAFDKDLILKINFEYPGKPTCSLQGDRPIKVEKGTRVMLFWNIDPECKGEMTLTNPDQ